MTSKQQKIADEYAKSMTDVAVTLLDVIPAVFPDHMLLKQLTAERDALKKAFLSRYWRDNGPWALWRAIDFWNRTNALCACTDCAEKTSKAISVRCWDNLKHYLTMCGLTFAVIINESEAEFDEAAVCFKTCIRFDVSPKQSSMAFPVPDGFNRLTACPYMSPVSHVKEAHIVFSNFGTNLGITYGRKLWEKIDGPVSNEITKLDLLFARLRIKDSMTQALQALL
jgi:hypothetical protein